MKARKLEGRASARPSPRSAPRANEDVRKHVPPHTPREIEVHIEELVLHGFDPHSRWSVADALENQLRGLLAERGLPPAWLENPACLTTASKAGEGIAEAVYRGGAKP